VRRLEICPAEDLPPGEMRRVEVPGGAPIAVYHTASGFHATADTCSHALASLTDGDLEDEEVLCPVHWARFDVRTGEPQCFPATVALAVYRVEVVGGVVTVLHNEEEEEVA
jgi:nitrite reductase/ring-hydroxylating ferredoxin subunit